MRNGVLGSISAKLDKDARMMWDNMGGGMMSVATMTPDGSVK
jgi:hypothetical protein